MKGRCKICTGLTAEESLLRIGVLILKSEHFPQWDAKSIGQTLQYCKAGILRILPFEALNVLQADMGFASQFFLRHIVFLSQRAQTLAELV